MFHRVSLAIIAPDIVSSLVLSPQQFGFLAAVYFYAVAFTQIPLGLLLDRYGPRRVVTVLALLGAAGSFLFAGAQSAASAYWTRSLIGVGMAAVLMGTFKVFTAWFSPREFATLSGGVIAIGALGALLATTPLSLLVKAAGWRNAYRYAALGTGAIALLVAAVIRDRPRYASPPRKVSFSGGLSPWKVWKQVFADRNFWLIAASSGLRYSVFIAIQGVWAAPYFSEVLGMSRLRTSQILLSMSIGYIIGCPLMGFLSDRIVHSRKWVLIPSLGVSVFALLPLIWRSGSFSFTGFVIVLFFYGLTGGSGGLMFAHCKDLFPLAIAATVMTSVNFFSFLSVAGLQQLLGAVIGAGGAGRAGFSSGAFHLAFAICIGAVLLALISYLFTQDPR